MNNERRAEHPSVVVVMPAYNATRTLRRTYEELPKDACTRVIVVDDGSRDDTVETARRLNLQVYSHNRNYGYGANQKTCYREALRVNADIIVMLHPDYQYDPTLLPEMVQPIREGRADIVLGSRFLSVNPVKQGMPWWKFVANLFLTKLENTVFGLRLSEYHTGYRSYSARALRSINFEMNSDRFIFDQEIIAQFVCADLRIAEIAVPTRYFPEASSASFVASCRYGLSILGLLVRFQLHRMGALRSRALDSLSLRYSAWPEGDPSIASQAVDMS